MCPTAQILNKKFFGDNISAKDYVRKWMCILVVSQNIIQEKKKEKKNQFCIPNTQLCKVLVTCVHATLAFRNSTSA